ELFDNLRGDRNVSQVILGEDAAIESVLRRFKQ
ncbi:MAG: 30S ribosomal protein S21, partial [Leptolyngbyaceae cyanobacterium CRU_2_3]|nr:30S ribosomal protein S21 [Leptolyngbyaceae cyanobacterium CRU_2_3]